MVNVAIAVMAALLATVFVAVMCACVLPKGDQVVKKTYGPVEAYLTTRLCCICVALPFYVFTIWMVLVVAFDFHNGLSIIDQVCPDDFSCTQAFAMGRENFDKSACKDLNCGTDNLYARAGSQPLHFPRLGLGRDPDYSEEVVSYTCTEFQDFNGSRVCVKTDKSGSKDVCTCAFVDLNLGAHGLCAKWDGCDGDIEQSEATTKCTDDACDSFFISKDSAKQFSFQHCNCTDAAASGACSAFTCEELTMDYFYPNVFFAGCVTILFIFPTLVLFYYTLKTQLRKICKCNEMKLYVYNQEAGMQNELTGDNLATGGFTNTVDQKRKYRTFGYQDVLVFLFSPLVVVGFSWLVVKSAGRVGLAFIGVAAGLITAVELYWFIKMVRGQNDRLADRVDNNNPRPQYF